MAQANTGLAAGKRPASTSNCRPTAQVLADGSLTLTDCSGAQTNTNLFAEAKRARPTSEHSADSGTKPLNPGYVDPQTNSKYQESLRAALDYQIYSYAQAQKTFDWQYWSSKIIFWMVLLVVIAGLAFSGLQFYLGFTLGGTRRSGVTTLEASLKGIKVSSSVLGVIILTISIVFFYLYLKFVYPITNVSG